MGEMVFIREKYTDESIMWNDIRDFIHMLMHNGRICTIHDEDFVVVVKYNNNEWLEPMGCDRPVWLSEYEYETILDYRRMIREENGCDD